MSSCNAIMIVMAPRNSAYGSQQPSPASCSHAARTCRHCSGLQLCIDSAGNLNRNFKLLGSIVCPVPRARPSRPPKICNIIELGNPGKVPRPEGIFALGNHSNYSPQSATESRGPRVQQNQQMVWCCVLCPPESSPVCFTGPDISGLVLCRLRLAGLICLVALV